MIWRAFGLIAMIAAASGVGTSPADAGFSFTTKINSSSSQANQGSNASFSFGAFSGSAIASYNGDGTQEVEIPFLSQTFTNTSGIPADTVSVTRDVTIVIADPKGNTSGDLTVDEHGSGEVTGTTGQRFDLFFALGLNKTSFMVGNATFVFDGYKEYSFYTLGGTPQGQKLYIVEGNSQTPSPLTALFRVSGASPIVPEPSSLVLVALGGLGLGPWLIWRRRVD